MTKEDIIRIEAKSKEFDSWERKLSPLKDLVCVRCETPFKSRMKTAKYCSQHCRRLAHYNNRLKEGLCPRCGEKRPLLKGHVWCEECRKTHRRVFYPRLNGTLPIPDNGKCNICGSSETLSWHHVIPRRISHNDSPENLILFCKKCHANGEERVTRMSWKYFLETEIRA